MYLGFILCVIAFLTQATGDVRHKEGSEGVAKSPISAEIGIGGSRLMLRRKGKKSAGPSCTDGGNYTSPSCYSFLLETFCFRGVSFLFGVSDRRVDPNFARYAYSWKTYKKKEELVTRVTDVNVKQSTQQNAHNHPVFFYTHYFLLRTSSFC